MLPTRKKRDSQQPSQLYITATELARRWRLHPSTIRRRFRNQPGVIKFVNAGRGEGKRDYVAIRIPKCLVLDIERGVLDE